MKGFIVLLSLALNVVFVTAAEETLFGYKVNTFSRYTNDEIVECSDEDEADITNMLHQVMAENSDSLYPLNLGISGISFNVDDFKWDNALLVKTVGLSNEETIAANQRVQDEADTLETNGIRTPLNACTMANRASKVDECVGAHSCNFGCGFSTVISDKTLDTAGHGVMLNVWEKFGNTVTRKFRQKLDEKPIECLGIVDKLLIDLDAYVAGFHVEGD